MIEIWVELAKFKRTNQTFAFQVWTMIKKGWFSELEILEIHKQIYKETYQYTITLVKEKQNAETSN